MSSRSLVSAEICWNKAQVSFTAARSCFFFLVLATAGTEQAVLAQDALDGHVAQRQLPFALQAPGAEGGQLTNHVEVGDGSRHRPPILSPPAAALVPPHQGSQLPPPHLTQTLQHHRGDTMYLSNSK